ncbi:hypothetical protein E1258_16685 [Micromonospora sp. KC207]|nr:hypothetical protein E1258_16685 [Micromonospora sp. KC207]
MGIQFATPPSETETTAMTGLREIARSAQFATAGGVALMTAPADNAVLSAPHPVHHVGLDAVAARRPLTEAPTTGWRFLVTTESTAVASSEVATDANGQPERFEQVNEGPYVQSTAWTLRDLAGAPEVQTDTYEPHLLKIPGIYVVALWLRQLDGDGNLFVPLAPAPDFLEAGRVYREDDLLDRLAEPARQRLEFDDTPQS